MQFARDVAKQLRGAVASKLLAKRNTDGDERRVREREREEGYRALRKALCIGYGCKLAQRMARHNGYRTVHTRSRLVEVRWPLARHNGYRWVMPVQHPVQPVHVLGC